MLAKLLKAKGRYSETLFLGILTFLCFSFSIFRLTYTDTKVFLFLNWNLFLAFVPWGLTSLVYLKPKLQQKRLTLFILLAAWLLFFPNALYILTDLFHLRLKSAMPIWFDLILILSFAWTGLLFGLFSLFDIEHLMTKHLKEKYVTGDFYDSYVCWKFWNLYWEIFTME